MSNGEARKKEPRSPLKVAWYALTSVASVASLSNMVGDLVQWKGLIEQLLEAYSGLVYPVFWFLLGWIPLEIPEFVFDYLTLGIIVTGTFVKVVIKEIIKQTDTVFGAVSLLIGYFLFWFWIPVIFLYFMSTKYPIPRQQAIAFFSWLGVVILGFFGLLLLNVVIGL